MQHLNKVSTLEVVALMRGTRTCQSRRLPYGKLAANEAALFGCRSYTFLKMQQLREYQFSKTVALMRRTRIRQ